jgi:hypothetical protein
LSVKIPSKNPVFCADTGEVKAERETPKEQKTNLKQTLNRVYVPNLINHPKNSGERWLILRNN